MAKTVSDLNDLPLTQETPAMQTSLESLNAYINAPVFKKLDADEYMANDLDGVTENLLGSGNLNFLMMQAGQTDESIGNTLAADSYINGDNFASSPLAELRSIPTAVNGGPGYDASMDRGFNMPSLSSDDSNGFGEHNQATSSLASSNLSSNAQSTRIFSDTSSSAKSFASTESATNGDNGNNGKNGLDGEGGGGPTINNTTNNYPTTNETNIENNYYDNGGLGPVGLSLDATLDDLTNVTLDIISGNNIVNALDETIDLSPVLDPVGALLGDILTSASLDVILNPFQYDASPNDFDLHVGTDLDILGLTLPDLGFDIPLDAVEALVGDLDISLDAGQLLAGLPLLGGGTDNGDTNLQLAGLTDIPALAPVIDLTDGIFNTVEDLAGDVDILGSLHVGLLGIGQDTAGTDTDITIPLDLGLIDTTLLNDTISIGLDPLENIIGDVDLDVSAAANILGNTADGLIDTISGGTGTDNLIASVGDTLPSITENLVSSTSDASLSQHLDLLNIGDSQSSSDTDLGMQIDLVDSVLPPIDLPVNLDLVESVTGDIDLPIDISGNLLGDIMDVVDHTIGTAIDLLQNLPEQTGGLDLGALLPAGGDVGDANAASATSWTETLLPDAGSLLGDGLLAGMGDILPDPIAIIPAVTLPVVPVIPVIPSGGGHHGGLFGGGGLFG